MRQLLCFILSIFLLAFVSSSNLLCGHDELPAPTPLSIEEMRQLRGTWTPNYKCIYAYPSPDSGCREYCYDYKENGNARSAVIEDEGCDWCALQLPDTVLMECKMDTPKDQVCGEKQIWAGYNCTWQVIDQYDVYTYQCYNRIYGGG